MQKTFIKCIVLLDTLSKDSGHNGRFQRQDLVMSWQACLGLWDFGISHSLASDSSQDQILWLSVSSKKKKVQSNLSDLVHPNQIWKLPGSQQQYSCSFIPFGCRGQWSSMGLWVAFTLTVKADLLICLCWMSSWYSHSCSHWLNFPCPGSFSSRWSEGWKKKWS